MDPVIEYIAIDNDLVKVEVLNRTTIMGWRCGYVGVPKGHPLYGKKYEKLDFEVNGGLTYSDYNEKYDKEVGVNKYWYLGFDCAHSGDVLDRETKNKYNIPYNSDEFGHEFQRIWDKDSVINEVNNLTQQIRKGETQHLTMKHLHLADNSLESSAKTTEYKLLKYIVQIDRIDGRVHNVKRTTEIPLPQESIEMDALRINTDKKEKLSYWLIYETDDSALQALAEFAAGTVKQCFEDADLIKQMAKDLDDISQKYLKKFLGKGKEQ